MFIERRFFDDIAPRASGGPEYRTTIKTLRGGAEHRNALWADPLRTYNIALGPRDTTSVETVLDFMADAQGAANGFRIKDWSDFKLTGERIATGDAVNFWFRLVKPYGTTGYQRRILKPVAGTIQVRLNNVPLAATAFAVDTVNGLVIFKTAPGNGVAITVTGEFDVPVRFTEDMLNVVMLYHRSGQIDTLDLREIRLREVIDIAAINAIRAALP